MTSPTQLDALIEWLPQKAPFVFLDHIVALEPLVEARASKRFPAGDRVFDNHLPGRPLVPGVILIEALAQLSGIVLIPDHGSPVTGFLASVDRIRFKRLIEPDEPIELHSELIQRLGSAARFRVEALVGDETACFGELTLGGMMSQPGHS